MGLPDVSDRDRVKLHIGNATMLSSVHIIKAALKMQIPAILENPHSSRIFKARAMRNILRHRDYVEHVVDFCQYGARWRKRTRLASWAVGHTPLLSKKCCGRNGICSATNRPHIVLQGTDKVSKKLWTQIAQLYPPKLCHAGAFALSNASARLHLAHLTHRVI